MASLIQKKATSNNGINNLTITFTGNTVVGNIIVVTVAGLLTVSTPSVVTSVTDAAGNVYTKLVNIFQNTAHPDSSDCEIWWTKATTATTSGPTVTVSSSATFLSIAAYEINGYSTNGIMSSSGQGVTIANTTLTVASFTPPPSSFVVGAGCIDSGAGWAKDAAYSTLDANATWNNNEYQEVWGGGATSATLTNVGNSANLSWAETAAAFPISNQAVILYKVSGT